MYALTYVRAFGVSKLVSFTSASRFGILITFSTCNLQNIPADKTVVEVLYFS